MTRAKLPVTLRHHVCLVLRRSARPLLLTLAASIWGGRHIPVRAAQEPGFSQRFQQGGPAQGGGFGWGPDRMVELLRERLNLTDKQVQAVKPIATRAWYQRRSIRESNSLSPQQKYEFSKANRAATRARLHHLLTPAQRKSLLDLDTEFNERMRQRFLGDSNPRPSPPQRNSGNSPFARTAPHSPGIAGRTRAESGPRSGPPPARTRRTVPPGTGPLRANTNSSAKKTVSNAAARPGSSTAAGRAQGHKPTNTR